MMVEQFIDRLEQQGLLDKSVIDDLRRKVAKVKGKKVTPGGHRQVPGRSRAPDTLPGHETRQ